MQGLINSVGWILKWSSMWGWIQKLWVLVCLLWVFGTFGYTDAKLDKELLDASFRGDLGQVEKLIGEGADVDAKTDRGVRSLHVSAEQGHIEIVKILLEKGADVDARTLRGATPLDRASYGGHLEVVKLLVDGGASLDFSGNVPTPLHTAALRGYVELVEYFLEQDVEIDVLGLYGSTPLHWASGAGNFLVVKRLVDWGADMESRSEDGTLPFHWAVLWTPVLGTLTEERKLNKFRIVRFFLEQGIDVRVKTRNGQTASQLAKASKLLDIHEFLKSLEQESQETLEKEKDSEKPKPEEKEKQKETQVKKSIPA